MIKIVIFVLSCSILTGIVAQSDDIEISKKCSFGFNMGINYSSILSKSELPNNASIQNGPGYRLGILAHFDLSKTIFFSPKAALSFNSGSIDFANIDGTHTPYNIMPTSLDAAFHIGCMDRNKGVSPYFYIGPSISLPIPTDNFNSGTFNTGKNLSVDFGIGLDKGFQHFRFSPELKYSYGLVNINKNPQLQSVYFHNISLIFNFRQ